MFIPQMKGYNNYAMCNSQYKKKKTKLHSQIPKLS